MRNETIVSVDEATKKFMGFINEEISATISDGINGALRKTNSDLEEISERANAILFSIKNTTKGIENITSVIEGSQSQTEQAISNEFVKNQQFLKEINEDANVAILAEQKKLDEILRTTKDDLEEIAEKENAILLSNEGISGAIEKITAAIDQAQKKTEEIILNELIKNQQLQNERTEDIKTVMLTEQKLLMENVVKLNGAYTKNQEDILVRILAFEEKLEIANVLVEGQAFLLERLDKIEEKINYLKLPFYKRWFNKGV